jgi:hypothetical protein
MTTMEIENFIANVPAGELTKGQLGPVIGNVNAHVIVVMLEAHGYRIVDGQKLGQLKAAMDDLARSLES